jgi:hypothetical protein
MRHASQAALLAIWLSFFPALHPSDARAQHPVVLPAAAIVLLGWGALIYADQMMRHGHTHAEALSISFSQLSERLKAWGIGARRFESFVTEHGRLMMRGNFYGKRGGQVVIQDMSLFYSEIAEFAHNGCPPEEDLDQAVETPDSPMGRLRAVLSLRVYAEQMMEAGDPDVRRLHFKQRREGQLRWLKQAIQREFRGQGWKEYNPCWEDYFPRDLD